MSVNICLLQSALAELFAQVSQTEKITLADRYGLLAALLDESLGDEEKYSIDRILYATYRGRVRIVNELSAVIS
jgi:hypothetical protein